MIIRFLLIFIALMLGGYCVAAEKEDIATIEQLESKLLQIMQENNVPAAGVAIIERDGQAWVKGLGLADVESNMPASEQTLFRIGSISKMFVGFAALKLVEENKLSLNDTLKNLAPEIPFDNPWEDTHPVRFVHLLEHTTGWDDIHLSEYAHNDPTPISLKDALYIHPHSRVSRWRPGTRFAYSNIGPAIAAYVIAKISGKQFEDYVQQNIFKPTGMYDATYYESEHFLQYGASLYVNNEQQPYWHIAYRPSGAINASANSMAGLLNFLINRGEANKQRILSNASIKRAEQATSTLAAEKGMQEGYGLGIVAMRHQGHTLYGHNGGVIGGLSELMYVPKAGTGYAILINTSDGLGLMQLSEVLKNFITRNLPEPVLPSIKPLTETQKELAGFYQVINPRAEFSHFIGRLLSFDRLSVHDDKLIARRLLGGPPVVYVNSDDNFLRVEDGPLSALSAVDDPEAGRAIQTSMLTLEPVSGISAILQLTIAVLFIAALLISLLKTFYWIPSEMFRKTTRIKNSSFYLRLFSSLATLSFVGIILLVVLGSADPFVNFGSITPWSVGIFSLSLLFPVSCVISSILFYCCYQQKSLLANFYYSFVISTQLLVTLYLGYWGAIGTQTWA